MDSLREELAWAAGLFDGEGWVGIRRRDARHKDQLALSITQADRRVLDRFRAVVRAGGVYGPYTHGPAHYKPRWSYVAVDFEDAQAVVGMLWSWLSPVKRQQAHAAIVAARIAAASALGSQGSRPTCIRGHAFDVDSTQKRHGKVYRARYCRACQRERHATRRDVRRMVAALLEA